MIVNQAKYDDLRRWLDRQQQYAQNSFRKDYPPQEVDGLIRAIKTRLNAMVEDDTQ